MVFLFIYIESLGDVEYYILLRIIKCLYLEIERFFIG